MNLARSAAGDRVSPRYLALTVVAVLLLLAVLAPAAATAGEGGGGSSPNCEATVRSTQDPGVAAIDVECDAEIASVEVDTTEDGSLEGNQGTECEGQRRSFTCRPTDSSRLVSAQFDSVSGDVCADPRLTVDFAVAFDDPEMEDERITNVEVSGCADSGGGGGEDDGATPEGGVDSGAGGTAKASPTFAAGLPLAGGSLVVFALAVAALALRRNRTNP